MTECLFTGDLVLDEPNPDHWLSGLAPTLQQAALVVGHLEVPHTRHQQELADDIPAPGAAPEHLAALARAGFHAVTLAGNHIADCGAVGIADTRRELQALNIRCCGAGANAIDAFAPARLDHAGHRLALLSYNCVGPSSAWAQAERAGCAYLRVDTADGSAIAPSAPLQRVAPESLTQLQSDIAAARRWASHVVVALHKGRVHTPIIIEAYEQVLARAAIDAGADVVIGHHAHIVKGIEFYHGKPIFHGLGNGCVVTRALSPTQDHPKRAEWAKQRQQRFGFTPDPDYFLAPFHPQAVHGMVACVRLREDAAPQAGFIPVFVEAPGRPIIARAARRQQVIDYVAQITVAANLPALQISHDEDHVWLN